MAVSVRDREVKTRGDQEPRAAADDQAWKRFFNEPSTVQNLQRPYLKPVASPS
jgi:hypothetical protein